MISRVSLKELNEFNRLGFLVNSNFGSLFNLNDIIESSYDDVFGYYLEGELIGFIHITKMYEVVDIVNIVVDVQHRNQGIATQLMEYVFSIFNDVTSFMLEVSEKNRDAFLLYKKLGFNVINTRKKYYGNDDAYIMKRDVDNEKC